MVKNSYCKFSFKKIIQMITEIQDERSISNAIARLEQNKILQRQQLTNHFEKKIQSLKPGNLLKSATVNIIAKPSLKKGLMLTAGSITAVMLIKKVLRGGNNGKGLFFMLLSGVSTMLVKKMVANGIKKTL